MAALWMEPGGDARHHRHNSFSRCSGNLSGPNNESDNWRSDVDATLDGARKKLQWISRGKDQKKARNSMSNGHPSVPSGSVHGRSVSLGFTDCPGRGIPNPRAESQTRRVASMRRTTSMDFDVIDFPSSGPSSRSTPRSTSAVPKSDEYMDESQPVTKYMTHSTSLSRNDEDYVEGNRGRRNESSESLMRRLNFLTDTMTTGEIDHGSESLRHITLQTEQTPPSNSSELGTTGASVRIVYKVSPEEHFSHEKMTSPGTYPRQPAARSQSQKYQEVRRLLLPGNVLGDGSGDKFNFFRRSKSLQRGSKIHPAFDSSEENEARIPVSKPAVPSGFDNSSDSKTSSDALQGQSPFQSKIEKLQKFLFSGSSDHKSSSGLDTSKGQTSVDLHFSSSTDAQLKEQSKFQSQIEKLQKFLFNPSSDHDGRRRSSFTGPERGDSPSSSSSNSFNPVFLGDSQFSEKRQNVSQQERPTSVHRISLSIDQPDSGEMLFVQTKKDNQSGRSFASSNPQASFREASPHRWFANEVNLDKQSGETVPTSTSALKAGSMNPPRTSRSPFRGTSPQRWFANQVEKVGSFARSHSTGRGGGLQEVERKPRKASPWRRRPGEILQGIFPERRGRSSKWHEDPENCTPLGF